MQENPDENLLVAVGDALPALAAASRRSIAWRFSAALGPETYAPIFAQQHAEALFKWMRGSQPDSVRAAGMGEPSHAPSILFSFPALHMDFCTFGKAGFFMGG